MTRIRFSGCVLSLGDEAPRWLHVTIGVVVRRFVELIADTWILDVAAGLLLGFAVLDFIQSLSSTAVQFWTSKDQAEGAELVGLLDSLTIKVGDRVLFLAPVVQSALTLIVALVLVAFLIRRLSAADKHD
jgi:hypothetical protein